MNGCDKVGCTNEGKWSPVLLIYAPREYKYPEPIKAPLRLRICDQHRELCTVADFVCDEGWQQIVAGLKLRNYIEPDRALTQLAWKPFTESDWIGAPKRTVQ